MYSIKNYQLNTHCLPSILAIHVICFRVRVLHVWEIGCGVNLSSYGPEAER